MDAPVPRPFTEEVQRLNDGWYYYRDQHGQLWGHPEFWKLGSAASWERMGAPDPRFRKPCDWPAEQSRFGWTLGMHMQTCTQPTRHLPPPAEELSLT